MILYEIVVGIQEVGLPVKEGETESVFRCFRRGQIARYPHPGVANICCEEDGVACHPKYRHHLALFSKCDHPESWHLAHPPRKFSLPLIQPHLTSRAPQS